jgi:hypothetical protein
MSFRPIFFSALVALLLLVSPASAQEPAARSCAAPGPSTQVFWRSFADPAFYYVAPDGSFERRAWSGGTLVAGNEPYFVGGRGTRSMGVARPVTSPAMCITIDAPTIRFFARQTSGKPGWLGVAALVPVAGRERVVPLVPVHGGRGQWTLTPPTLILANLANLPDILGVLSGRAATRVRFVLAPAPGTTWQVDDFYVDPYRRH